jgi:hypothetical protein
MFLLPERKGYLKAQNHSPPFIFLLEYFSGHIAGVKNKGRVFGILNPPQPRILSPVEKV